MAKKTMSQTRTDEDVLVLEKEEIEEPRRYAIILHNDDFTTQDFVTHVLINFLYKSPSEAHNLMLKVHLEGKAKVGSFIKDIAETKVELITVYSRQHGMPLLATIDEE
jgi:ATP-dependent Clp protease adaptor protein ClpS